MRGILKRKVYAYIIPVCILGIDDLDILARVDTCVPGSREVVFWVIQEKLLS